MNKQIKLFFDNWKSWIENEKRLAFKTSQSYCIDVKSFLNFLSNHNNLNVDLKKLLMWMRMIFLAGSMKD